MAYGDLTTAQKKAIQDVLTPILRPSVGEMRRTVNLWKQVHKGASTPNSKFLVNLGDHAIVLRCYVHNPGAVGLCIILQGTGGLVRQNHVDTGTDDSATGISTGNSYSCTICQNVVRCNHTVANGIATGPANGWVHVFDDDA